MSLENEIFGKKPMVKPGRSVFDLSYRKLFTCDFGQLIPVAADIVFPGDVFQLGSSILLRMQPLVAPVMHEMWVYYHSFYVPIRILDPDNWEDYIYGGKDGDDTYTIPRWTPTLYGEDSLWDLMGLPVGVVPTGHLPMAYLLYAYNKIYNYHYRDINLIDEVDLDDEAVKKRAWTKDYFTSSMTSQQRGIVPAMSMVIDASGAVDSTLGGSVLAIAIDRTNNMISDSGGTGTYDSNIEDTLEKLQVTGFDLADLRLNASIARYQELSQRAGFRIAEMTKALFGQDVGDHRVQEPEWIGGTKSAISINEVLQNSETGTTPQGHMAGHGISNRDGKVGTFRVPEHGIIMSILSIMPEATYQQGVDRQWMPETRWDWYNPLLGELSEQAILTGEIYATGVESENKTVFGYQRHWDQHRTKRNLAVGQMRGDFDFMHLSRKFSSAPTLNQTFIEVDAETGGSANPLKRCFAATDEPGFMVDCGNLIRATRPIPAFGQPGIGRL